MTLYDQGLPGLEDSTDEAAFTDMPASRPTRLIVIANRLPVSAVKDSQGRWALQAWPYEPDGLDVRPCWQAHRVPACLLATLISRPRACRHQHRTGCAACGSAAHRSQGAVSCRSAGSTLTGALPRR